MLNKVRIIQFPSNYKLVYDLKTYTLEKPIMYLDRVYDDIIDIRRGKKNNFERAVFEVTNKYDRIYHVGVKRNHSCYICFRFEEHSSTIIFPCKYFTSYPLKPLFEEKLKSLDTMINICSEKTNIIYIDKKQILVNGDIINM